MPITCNHCSLPDWPGADKAEKGKDYHQVQFSLTVASDASFSDSETVGPYPTIEDARKALATATKVKRHFVILEFHLLQKSTEVGWMIGDFKYDAVQGAAMHMTIRTDKEVKRDT